MTLRFPQTHAAMIGIMNNLSVGTPALAVASGSGSARSQGFARSALNKGGGKSAENLLAFSILLLIRHVFFKCRSRSWCLKEPHQDERCKAWNLHLKECVKGVSN